MDNNLSTITKQYVYKVGQELGLTEAYLYGSQARGTATDNSDVDIAFVYRNPVTDIKSFYDIYGKLYIIAAEFEEDIEPVLVEADDDFFNEVQRTGLKIEV